MVVAHQYVQSTDFLALLGGWLPGSFHPQSHPPVLPPGHPRGGAHPAYGAGGDAPLGQIYHPPGAGADGTSVWAQVTGMAMEPLTGRWELSEELSVNYIMLRRSREHRGVL
jgi:hypothetical protein